MARPQKLLEEKWILQWLHRQLRLRSSDWPEELEWVACERRDIPVLDMFLQLQWRLWHHSWLRWQGLSRYTKLRKVQEQHHKEPSRISDWCWIVVDRARWQLLWLGTVISGEWYQQLEGSMSGQWEILKSLESYLCDRCFICSYWRTQRHSHMMGYSSNYCSWLYDGENLIISSVETLWWNLL